MLNYSNLHSSPERQFIRSLCGLNPPETGINIEYSLDWAVIQEKTDLHGVAPLIYHHLKQLPNDAVTQLRNNVIPSQALGFFKQQYYENLARNIALFQELKEILQSLRGRGIKVMVLKGAALAETVYKNLALRPMSDLDLLIRKQDLAQAERELSDLGYFRMKLEFSGWWAKRFGGERLYAKKCDFPVYVDIHWNIATPSVKVDSDRRQAEIDRIWKEARLTKIAGIDAWSMPVEDLILHASVHLAAQHLHFRLIWLRDICELSHQYQGQINWEKIVENVRYLKLGGPVYACFKYTREWLGAPIPKQVLSELKPSYGNNSLEAKAHNFLTDMDKDSTGIKHHFYQYLSIPGISNKGLFLFGAIFPGVAYLRNRYQIPQSRMVYLCYLYRPCYIFYRASMALLKLIRLLISKKVRNSRLKAPC